MQQPWGRAFQEEEMQGRGPEVSAKWPGGQRGSGLNLCPVAAVTKYHKLALKQQKCILPRCWELEI